MSIDVIIPVFNQAKYLKDSIKSVIMQGVKVNIYVIDDASSDNPEDLVKNYDINLIKNKKNLGPAGARNVGAGLGKSEYIAFLDADDMMLKDRLNISLSEIKKSDMICGNYKLLINRIRITGPFYKNPPIINRESLLKQNYVASGSVMIKRSIFEKLGGFNEEYRLAEDYDLWVRLSERYSIKYVHKPLYLYSRNLYGDKTLTTNPDNLKILLSNIDKIKKDSVNRAKNECCDNNLSV